MRADLPGSQEAIEAWNTVLFDKFTKYRVTLTTGLGIHGTRAMDRHTPPPGARVVDIGCGARPTRHIFVGVKAAWLGIHDSLPQFQTKP